MKIPAEFLRRRKDNRLIVGLVLAVLVVWAAVSVLEQRAERPLEVLVGRLSGGERQRLHLARAFIQAGGEAPWLVVLDEPEAGLDATARDHVAGLLARASRERRVMLIAHDPRIIPPTFDTVRCRRGPV